MDVLKSAQNVAGHLVKFPAGRPGVALVSALQCFTIADGLTAIDTELSALGEPAKWREFQVEEEAANNAFASQHYTSYKEEGVARSALGEAGWQDWISRVRFISYEDILIGKNDIPSYRRVALLRHHELQVERNGRIDAALTRYKEWCSSRVTELLALQHQLRKAYAAADAKCF